MPVARRHLGRLRGALPAGRRLPAVRPGADELPVRGGHRRLPHHGGLVAEGAQGSQGHRRHPCRGDRRGLGLHPDSCRGVDHLVGGAGLRPPDHQQHHLWHPMGGRARCAGRGPAGGRHLERHVQPADRRLPVWDALCRSPEEPRPLGRGARDHSEGPGREGVRRTSRSSSSTGPTPRSGRSTTPHPPSGST